MQSVPGVLYVDLDTFGRIETLAPDGTLLTPDQITAKVRDLANKADVRVAVEMARFEAGAILPAQLAVLTADVPATLVLNRIE